MILKQIVQALPVFTFANQAGLDMLETTFISLQDITLEKIFDDHGKKSLCSEFPQIMQQVYVYFMFFALEVDYSFKSYHKVVGNRFKDGAFYFRVLHVFKVAFACQAWEGRFRLREQ